MSVSLREFERELDKLIKLYDKGVVDYDTLRIQKAIVMELFLRNGSDKKKLPSYPGGQV
jgi:hypothetical protein